MEPLPPATGASDDDDRLESWKVIAGFLNRDIRTVQRWEQREGLPVRRHQHDKQASVYAYRSELRAWQESRNTPPDVEPPDVEPPDVEPPDVELPVTVASSYRWIAATLAVLLGAGAWVMLRPSAPVPAPRLPAFEMLAADLAAPPAVSDATAPVREAIAARWLDAGGQHVSHQVIRSTLPLMRWPSGSGLSAEVAREVALRAGGVHVVFEPRVDAAASGYLLTLVAWGGPEAREEVARVSVKVAAHDARTLASEFASLAARALGGLETASLRPTRGLPPVSTSSLEALRQFAEADALMRRGLSSAAIPLLHGAIGADPQFAAAYAHLAWALDNTRRPMAEVRPYLERAMELREMASDRERWFIAGTFHQLTGRLDDAEADYERTLALAPDHYWSLGNLARIKHAQGEHEAGARLILARAQISPDSLSSQVLAADVAAAWGRKEDARLFRKQAAALLGSVSPAEPGIPETWLPLWSACDAWERGDVSAAAAVADGMRRRMESDPVMIAETSIPLGLVYLDLGMTRRADDVFERAAPRQDRHQYLAMSAAARGDWPLARRRLLEFSRTFEGAVPATGLLLLEAGLAAEADRLMARWDRERFWPDYVLAPFRAAVRATRGEAAEARRLLDGALPQLTRPDLSWIGEMPTSSMPLVNALRLDAQLQRREGRLREALVTLEQADLQRFPMCTAHQRTGSAWLALRLDLAAMYREQGSVDRAKAIEADLEARLALADRDHAVLAALHAAPKD